MALYEDFDLDIQVGTKPEENNTNQNRIVTLRDCTGDNCTRTYDSCELCPR